MPSPQDPNGQRDWPISQTRTKPASNPNPEPPNPWKGRPMNETTTYHIDGTVTYWSVYQQQWVHTDHVPDRELAAMDSDERDRVAAHIGSRPETSDSTGGDREGKGGSMNDQCEGFRNYATFTVHVHFAHDRERHALATRLAQKAKTAPRIGAMLEAHVKNELCNLPNLPSIAVDLMRAGCDAVDWTEIGAYWEEHLAEQAATPG